MSFGAFPNDPGLGTQFLIAQAAAGAPTTGYWKAGSAIIDANGIVWLCTVTGTPGVWVEGASGAAGVTSFNGRSGAVVPVNGDYAVAQVTGAAPLASPTFTGVPLSTTPATADNSTKIATTAYVKAQPAPSSTSRIGSLTAVTALSAVEIAVVVSSVIPANTLAVGSTLRYEFLGKLLANNSITVNIRLGPLGTVADPIVMSGGQGGNSNNGWWSRGMATVYAIGAAGSILGNTVTSWNGGNPGVTSSTAPVAVNTTQANYITLSAVCGAGGTGDAMDALLELL